MTKIIMKERKNGREFGGLDVGDCFLDKNNNFCIKVNLRCSLITNENLNDWEETNEYSYSEEVYPVDVEIHIVS